MDWFETGKQDFLRLIKEAKDVRFTYYASGNDPCNPCGTVKKQATYEFYVIVDGKGILIVYKNHRRSHDEVREQLIKKYTYWTKCALKVNFD